ncbi:YczE/YyaS/YitT family protein [Pseudomonas sp. 2835]|uniref:YczE/YyaS/YitT family protein n=1 Tax=Pseudomonas sp. 2835 TaxID=3156451 RepID=UPI003D22B685
MGNKTRGCINNTYPSFRQYLTGQLFGFRHLKVDQVCMYLVGVGLFSLGAKLFIMSHLGTDPLDVLIIAFNQILMVGMGVCSAIVSLIFLSWWMLWNKKYPPISPFITTTLTGLLIDLWTVLDLEGHVVPHLNAYAMLALGLLLCAYASALIIMSGVGIRIMDLVVLTMVAKWRWSFTQAKMFIEIGIFSTGWLLGGPFGVGTLLFLLVIGPLIQPFMTINARHFSLTNHGLASAS